MTTFEQYMAANFPAATSREKQAHLRTWNAALDAATEVVELRMPAPAPKPTPAPTKPTASKASRPTRRRKVKAPAGDVE